MTLEDDPARRFDPERVEIEPPPVTLGETALLLALLALAVWLLAGAVLLAVLGAGALVP